MYIGWDELGRNLDTLGKRGMLRGNFIYREDGVRLRGD